MDTAGCSYDIHMSLVSLKEVIKSFHSDQYSISTKVKISRHQLSLSNDTCRNLFSSFMLYWAALLIDIQKCITWYFPRQAHQEVLNSY